MASTYTPLGIELMQTGENAGTWGSKTNANLNLVEQLAGGFKQVSIAGTAQTTDLTVATDKVKFILPYAFTLTGISASVTTAPTGATLVVDVNEGGTSIMTTNKIVIDVSETSTATAATAPTLTDSSLASGSLITIDVDQIGSTVAGAGLKVYLTGYQS